MPILGRSPPRVTRLNGSRARAYVDTLSRTECPALTARRARRAEMSGAPTDPLVWASATGVNVVDVDGNVFVDLTAGFGVAAFGHRDPRSLRAVRNQSTRLVHGLGDVHPSAIKIELLSRLAEMAPFPSARVMLGTDGADAVEAALKTAMLATRRPGVLAFEGGYHGLTLGAVAACGYSSAFRAPFAPVLSPHVRFAPFPSGNAELPATFAAVDAALADRAIGAVLVEPIQARGGVRVPPKGFLEALRACAHRHGALLVVDEIYTGLGRCGALFASDVRPDIVCVGKALGGGLPVSACLAPESIMTAWGDPGGEAIHTGTFFGHPLACAAALTVLARMSTRTFDRVRTLGRRFIGELVERLRAASFVKSGIVRAVRGKGLLVGLELSDGPTALRVVRALLERGYLVLPAGADARVISMSPPLTFPVTLVRPFAAAVVDAIEEVA